KTRIFEGTPILVCHMPPGSGLPSLTETPSLLRLRFSSLRTVRQFQKSTHFADAHQLPCFQTSEGYPKTNLVRVSPVANFSPRPAARSKRASGQPCTQADIVSLPLQEASSA